MLALHRTAKTQRQTNSTLTDCVVKTFLIEIEDALRTYCQQHGFTIDRRRIVFIKEARNIGALTVNIALVKRGGRHFTLYEQNAQWCKVN